MNLEDKQKEQKTKEPQGESHHTKMNKWYLKEFEDQMGLEIGGSDDSGDAYDSKSEKTISSDSDKISDSDDSNSDGRFLLCVLKPITNIIFRLRLARKHKECKSMFFG